MDVNYLKADSELILKKCDGSSEVAVDRISKLPDEIIVYILSLLSLREAVSTSALSSRWYDLWTRIPNLDLNTQLLRINLRKQIESLWDPEKCKYIEMVNSVLQLHKAPFLKEFKISVYVAKSAQRTVTKWLDFVFSRRVESLELDFQCDEGMCMVDLEESLRESMACRHQTLPVFESLKRLRLQSLKLSGEAIEFFLHNCPLLEQLFIEGAHLTSDVVVSGTTLGLKHLDIDDCTGQKSIKVFAPKLTWLSVDIQPENLVIENVPELSGANFTCICMNSDEVEHFVSAVFCCISQLKLLKLHIPFPKVFLSNGFPFPRMPNLEKLVLTCRGVYGHGLLPLTTFIWASPRLQEFKLEFIKMPRDIFAWREGLTNADRHPHRHLKVFKFKRFHGGAGDHMELLTYILNHCVALEKIILDCAPISGHLNKRAAWGRIKKQLQGIVPDHIQLCLL